MLGMFGFFLVVGVALLASPDDGAGGPPGWFMALWVGALAWNAYWWLFRVAYVLELSDTELRWRAPLAHGTVPVRALREV